MGTSEYETCYECRGSGSVRFLFFFSRNCPVCGGSGVRRVIKFDRKKSSIPMATRLGTTPRFTAKSRLSKLPSQPVTPQLRQRPYSAFSDSLKPSNPNNTHKRYFKTPFNDPFSPFNPNSLLNPNNPNSPRNPHRLSHPNNIHKPIQPHRSPFRKR